MFDLLLCLLFLRTGYCLLLVGGFAVGLCDVDIAPTLRVQRIDEEMVESHG